MAGKRAVSRARRTVVHHRDTLARTRVLLAARAGVPVARSDARGRDSKQGTATPFEWLPWRAFSLTRRRARGARAAPAARRRDTDDPSARAAPSPPPICAIPRALAHAAGARRRAEATPRPPVSRALALVASCLALVFSLPAAAAAGAAPRVVSRVAIHPDANDVTAAATASSRSRVVAALGTAAVPGRVHFLVSDAPGAWTHDGAFALPAGAGAVRSAAVVSGARHPTETYFALGTDRSPGVVVPAGELAGTPLVLEKGEDVLATAVASEVYWNDSELGTSGNDSAIPPTPCFVFATWTSPSRLVRVDVDEETRALRRAAATTLPLGVNRVRAAVADPRRLSFGDGADADGSLPTDRRGAPPFARVAHFASDTSPSALVTVRTHDLAIVDALIFPSSSPDSNAATDGSRVFKGAILRETDVEGGAASYWVTRPGTTLHLHADDTNDTNGDDVVPSASRGSTLFRVTHRRPDGGGATVAGAHAFRATERNVAAVSVERTNASAFGSDVAVVYVAFDAAADADASVVALAERRDRRTGAFAGFARIATVAVPGARALTLVRVADGVATYATRDSPAELVEVDFFNRLNRRTMTSAFGDDAVVAMRGPDASASEARASLESFESSEILCVAFLNATHFGATFLFAGGRVGAGGRRLVSAALAARGAAKGETWRARPC